jgi:hypothetical protein
LNNSPGGYQKLKLFDGRQTGRLFFVKSRSSSVKSTDSFI